MAAQERGLETLLLLHRWGRLFTGHVFHVRRIYPKKLRLQIVACLSRREGSASSTRSASSSSDCEDRTKTFECACGASGAQNGGTVMPTKFADGTKVTIERSKAEIERLVSHHGATAFSSSWNGEHARIIFRMNDRFLRFDLQIPALADF